MDLYFAPFACSLAAHITCREAGLPVNLRRVALMTKDIEGGGSLFDISPKGQVPTLRCDDGQVLTENPAVLQYLADLAPDRKLAPSPDSPRRYRLQEWLGFIGTELHKHIFYSIFSPDSDDAAKARARAAVPRKLDVVAQGLAGQPYLLGDDFTVADAYLTWWLTLAPRAGIAAPDGVLADYLARCTQRSAVQSAIGAEAALLKA